MNVRLRRIIGWVSSIVILMCAGCLERKGTLQCKKIHASLNLSDDNKQDQSHVITVWIHGTRLLPKNILHNFFYSKPGLHLAKEMEVQYHLRTIAETISHADPHRFPLDTFYYFGWNGKLDAKERKQAARRLYYSLQNLINSYKKRFNSTPIIRIIAHSHGGNVALNLAKIGKDIQIDELILLACPAQEKTKYLIADSMFKKVYTLHSALDMIQVLDPQRLWSKKKNGVPLFSERSFPEANNIVQAKIKINKRAILHTEFILPRFLSHLPQVLDELDAWQQENSAAHKKKLLVIKIK